MSLPTPALILVLTLGTLGISGVYPLTQSTMPSELVPLRRGAAIGIANLFVAAVGLTPSPIIGGALADRFGLVVPLVLSALCLLTIAPVMLGVPETAPRVLARRGITPQQAVPA